jgi:uncharacterized protein YukE
MADIKLDYGTIQTVSGKLNSAEQNISPQLADLHTSVDGLLGQDGGLWMNKTSPALQSTYEQFNTNIMLAMNSINNFADMFRGIATSTQQYDSDSANQILHPPAA